MSNRPWILLPVVVLALVVAGCGSSKDIPPKQTLSEKEKQQVKELNEQREQEWGGPKKK